MTLKDSFSSTSNFSDGDEGGIVECKLIQATSAPAVISPLRSLGSSVSYMVARVRDGSALALVLAIRCVVSFSKRQATSIM